MSVTIKITRQTGTTTYEFETSHDTGSSADPYDAAETEATAFENWLSAMPDRIQLADQRSREGAR
jgi:hypothetical protein